MSMEYPWIYVLLNVNLVVCSIQTHGQPRMQSVNFMNSGKDNVEDKQGWNKIELIRSSSIQKCSSKIYRMIRVNKIIINNTPKKIWEENFGEAFF